MEIVGVSYPTVTNWYDKFREHLPKERTDTLLEGDVACDEMYTKGAAIIGAKQKDTRNIMLKVLHEKHPHRGHAVIS